MTSFFSAGQSISSIGKSMTAIARVEEHLATFMKKVIYFEKFFLRMGPNLPECVMDTATLLFQRCYEYRDEIRDELESSVAYVADAGRWVVGIGDWNSKMETRLNQISELVVLANTLLTEYAVTGEIGAEGCRDELGAYLQILAATVTLKNAPVNGKTGAAITVAGRPPVVRAQSTTAAEFSSEMSALGTEITGAFSDMFGNELGKSTSTETIGELSRPQADNDAMNPFADSYRRPVDPYATSAVNASISNSVVSLPDASAKVPTPTLSDSDMSDGPLSPVSMGEYECLDMDSIPKYAAFKSTAQLATRRQYTPSNGSAILTTSITSDGGRSAYSESSAEYHDLFPLPPSSRLAVSRSLSSLDASTAQKQKQPAKPIMDMNYSYDFQSEVAHNPFLSPKTPGPAQGGSAQQPPFSLDHRSNAHTNTVVCSSPAQVANGMTNEMDSVSISTTAAITRISEPVLGTVIPAPTLHSAIDYSQAQAVDGCAWSGNSMQTSTVSEEAGAAQAHHDNDHEYDLFGGGKS